MMEFSSNLSTHLAGFLAFKQSMGIQYKSCEYYLWRIDQFNLENGNYSMLTEDIVTRWLLKIEERAKSPKQELDFSGTGVLRLSQKHGNQGRLCGW